MKRPLSIRIAAILLAGACTLAAQNQPNASATISITVSNRSDLDLTLTLFEGRRMLPPAMPSLSSTSPQLPPSVELKTNQVQNGFIKQTVGSNQSAILEVSPGQYHLDALLTPPGPKMPSPNFGGYISITNAEVWIFTLEQKEQKVGRASWEWNLEVPSRPGFQLAILPEREQISRPQRTQRPDSPSPLEHPIPTRAIHFSTNSPR
jgi:hypothetical protein